MVLLGFVDVIAQNACPYDCSTVRLVEWAALRLLARFLAAGAPLAFRRPYQPPRAAPVLLRLAVLRAPVRDLSRLSLLAPPFAMTALSLLTN